VTHGSLFAGIGGFDLGFERAGIKTIWQVELDAYCRRVLAKHFPDAERFDDIRRCGRVNLKSVDVISGGFPCQDISTAGKRKGMDGERSGLWREYARIIDELRPKFAVVENVAALLERGIGRVLGDLSEIGYDAEWQTIPACHFGLPQLRKRIWILAYPNCERLEADADEEILQPQAACGWNYGHIVPMGGASVFFPQSNCAEVVSESDIVGSSARLPNSVDRLRGLGNAVVPQITEWIGRRILAT
jgi:DNA (cytosine-5)-methyltransferase 1